MEVENIVGDNMHLVIEDLRVGPNGDQCPRIRVSVLVDVSKTSLYQSKVEELSP